MARPEEEDFAATEVERQKFTFDAPAVANLPKPPPVPPAAAAPCPPAPPPPIIGSAEPRPNSDRPFDPSSDAAGQALTELDRAPYDFGSNGSPATAPRQAPVPRRPTSGPPPARVAPMPQASGKTDFALYGALGVVVLLIGVVGVVLAIGIAGSL